jgi:membrane protease subunit HflK
MPQVGGFPKFRWWLLVVVAVWILSGIYIVQPDESGVVLRFGRYVRTEAPGPHIHLPYPIEQVFKPKVSQVRQTAVGYRAQSVGGVFQQGRVQAVDEESAMLTGDENIITVQFNIQYQIKTDGAVDYLFNVIRPDQVVKRAAEASMREVIGKNTLDSALTDGRVKIQNDVAELLQNILDRYQVGVQVVAVQMQDVQPPQEVRDAFKDVASAREDKQRSINQAEAYRRDILPKAQGQAKETVNQAEAYRQTRIREAEGEAQRFLSVMTEYEKAPDVTKKRMLYETFEDILSKPGMEKLVLPSDAGSKVLPLLPLDSWKERTAGGNK